MIKIICISEIINVPSFITAGLITHDLIYEMVYLYAKFLELLIWVRWPSMCCLTDIRVCLHGF